MNFKTFLECVRKNVNEHLPGGLRADLKAVQKNNGTVLTGLTLTGHEASSGAEIVTSPILYMEEFYRRYLRQATLCENGERCGMAEYCPIKDDVEKGRTKEEQRSVYPCLNAYAAAITEILLTYLHEGPSLPDLGDYEAVKDRLMVQLVGYDANEERLSASDSARHEFLDMSVIYYLIVEGPDKENGGIRVTWSMLGDWGISEELLFADALENTRKMMGEQLLRFDEKDEGSDPEEYAGSLMVLSNDKGFYGASVLLYSEELPRISEELGSDLYILPSSVHEVILMPKDGQDPDELRRTVRRVNETEVRGEEVLTGSVYLYDRKEREIRIV